MAQIEVFQRYLHIIHVLSKRPSSLKEIQDYLALQAELDGQQYALSNRTFLRDKAAILSIFKLDIVYDEALKVYKLEEDESLESVPSKLVEAFNTFNALQFMQSIPDAVQLEHQKAKGIEHFRIILQAISLKRELHIVYQKFDTKTDEKRSLQPLLLKEFKNRWYVIGWDIDKKDIRTFGLDRILSCEISTKKFKKEKSLDVETYFKNSFGVVYGAEHAVQEIILEFAPSRGHYIKTMPLHPTQKIIEDNDTVFSISLNLIPSADFITEILSFGKDVKVKSPKSLQDSVKSALKKALEQYT